MKAVLQKRLLACVTAVRMERSELRLILSAVRHKPDLVELVHARLDATASELGALVILQAELEKNL